ncbi:MAG: hypothetical protein WD512_20510 [Candidatus Paceibacterota bacterium]
MENFKYLPHVPRLPLQLSKYDLLGVKVDPNYRPIKYIGLHPLNVYYPNINGYISFIIYHTHLVQYKTDHAQCHSHCHLVNCMDCDLKEGHLFLVTIPFNMINHFMVQYLKNNGNVPRFININIDDIFTFPIYDMDSLGKLIKYQRDLTFLSEPFPHLKCINIDILPYIRERNNIFWNIRYNIGVFVTTTNERRTFSFSNRNSFRYNIGFINNMITKLEKNKDLWTNSMKTLKPWTYSNSKEQLKIIWDSRNLELIDF